MSVTEKIANAVVSARLAPVSDRAALRDELHGGYLAAHLHRVMRQVPSPLEPRSLLIPHQGQQSPDGLVALRQPPDPGALHPRRGACHR